MSDLRVFSIDGQKVKSLEAKTLTLEKSLQNLIESNLEEMLGIRVLASEYSTGAKHGGRIAIHWVSMRTTALSLSSTSGLSARTSSTKVSFIWIG